MLWSTFTPFILPEVKEAPIPLIEAQVRRAAVDLCKRSQPWIGEIVPIAVVAGVGTYDPAPQDSSATVVEVQRLWFYGVPLKFIPLAQMRRYGGHWPSAIAAAPDGIPIGFTHIDDGRITLYPAPHTSAADMVKGLAVLAPSLNSTGVPDWFGEKFFDSLVCGAKARLLAMSAAPWFNPDAAIKYASLFDGASMSVALRRTAANRSAASTPASGETA